LWNVHGLRQVRQAAPSRLCFMHLANTHTTITKHHNGGDDKKKIAERGSSRQSSLGLIAGIFARGAVR
jgi:hypothetical protein